MFALFGIAILIFALGMIGLSVGLIVRGRSIRGHCGGTPVFGPDGRPLTCSHCNCDDEHKAGH